MRPKEGDLINGKYRLVRLIGDGGMGSVFEARHEYLGTAVALKFLHPELSRRPGLVARFLREARLSASIKSPHIAHVTDVDQATDGVAYLVMELLEGESLTSILDHERRLQVDVALDYTLQMLAGLEAAHAVGVVHRDLKPDNVFVVKTPRGPLVKLLDFGIAKLRSSKEFQLTRPGVMMGTPEYMAPEQVSSADTVDARADVYSVGAILYEMLAGKRPAPGDDATQIAAFILANKVTRLDEANPSVPRPLADVVHRAMAATATERFGSVGELRHALVPFSGSLSLAGRLAATPPAGGVAPTWPPEDPAKIAPTKEATPATQAAAASEGATARGPVPQPTPWTPAQPYAGAYVATPGPPAVDAHAPTRTRARSPRRFSAWLLLVMVAAAIGIVVLALTTSDDAKPQRTESVPATPTATATAAPTTAPAAAQATARATTAPITPPVQPPVQPAAPAATHPAAKPVPHADGGAPDAAPAAPPPILPGLPPIPFPLPSTLPPIPSSIPLPFPLPSAFPPINIPGFPQAPPAGSQ